MPISSLVYNSSKCRCCALTGLQELYLMGNRIHDTVIEEFAYALTFNRGLRVCDVRANSLSAEWFEPDTYIPTKLIDDMPSIRTSMDRNLKIHEDPSLTAKFSVKPRPMEDEVEGRWTIRRRWRKLNKKGEKERLEALANEEEQGRIDMEEEYIMEKLTEEMHSLDKFLASQEGILYDMDNTSLPVLCIHLFFFYAFHRIFYA